MNKLRKNLFLIAGIIYTSATFAQVKKGDFRLMVGYGIPNTPARVLSATSESSGPIGIGFKYFLNDKLSIGSTYNTSSATTDKININDGLGNDFDYSFGVSFNTFLTQIDYSWKNDEKYNLYSGFGIGYVSVSANVDFNINSGSADESIKFSATESKTAYHLTFIGLNSKLIGGLGAYAELGLGYNGIFNGGLSYSF
jgi:opacity protein-like surface antigen